MMDVALQFLAELERQGVVVWWRGDTLCTSPGQVTLDVQHRLQEWAPTLRRLRDESRVLPVMPHAAARSDWEFSPAPMMAPLLPTPAVPRVVFASHDLSLTGAPLILANLLPRLRGLTPVVYSPLDGPLKTRLLQAGIPVVHRLDLDGVDLLVANTVLSAPAVAEARRCNVPCVWLIHEFTPNTCENEAAVREVIDYPVSVFFPHPAHLPSYLEVVEQYEDAFLEAAPPLTPSFFATPSSAGLVSRAQTRRDAS